MKMNCYCFDPEIYNIENLKEQDKKKLTFWCDTYLGIVSGVEPNEDKENDTLTKIKHEIISIFCTELYHAIACEFQNIIISVIDNYPEEDIPKIKDYTTFYDYVTEAIGGGGAENND